MAANDRSNGAQGDLGAHAKTYDFFAALMKWGTIFSFLIAAVVVLLIAS